MPKPNTIIDLKIVYRGFKLGYVNEQGGYKAAWVSSLESIEQKGTKEVLYSWYISAIAYPTTLIAKGYAMKKIDQMCQIETREIDIGRKLTQLELNAYPLI